MGCVSKEDSRDAHIVDEDSIGVSTKRDSSTFDWNEFREKSLSQSFENSRMYNLSDTLREDFTGDGILDQAVFKKEGERAGILITDGASGKITQFGLGKSIAHIDDFMWVDYWGTVTDSTAIQILTEEDEITGSKEAKLGRVSIFVFEDEVGGGLITFKEGTYHWIHQAD